MKQTEESPELHHGANKIEQWYELNPQRWQEESLLMKQNCPDFRQYFDESQNACWQGVVKIEKIRGTTYTPKYRELEVKIICSANYPAANPFIEDVNRTLTPKSPHTINKTRLCYDFGYSSELDFQHKHKVANLYEIIQTYMVKQSIWEETGFWPEEQHHGIGAFIKMEYESGCVDPKEPCPCRITGKTYAGCHLPVVIELIAIINKKLRQLYGKRKLGPNMKCPCGSGIKFKKCCRWKDYYGVIRKDIIQLYSELTPDALEETLKKLDESFINKMAADAAPAPPGRTS